MDDLMLIRDLCRSVPGITDEAAQAARARLTAIISEPAQAQPPTTTVRLRVPRVAWRAVVAGATTAAIVAGVSLVLNVGGNRPSADAAEVLDHAATAAASRPFIPPRPDQWIYQRTRAVAWPDGQGKGPGWDTTRWTQASGNQVIVETENLPVDRFQVPAFPPQSYATISTLPVDADALLRWIRTHRPQGDRTTDFEVLSEILRLDAVLPPKLEAAIFQAMKTLPQVTISKDVRDLNGKATIAVIGQTSGSVGGVRTNDQVLLDPATYAYRGEQNVLTADLRARQKDGRTTITKSGAVDTASIVIQTAIVDKPGQHP